MEKRFGSIGLAFAIGLGAAAASAQGLPAASPHETELEADQPVEPEAGSRLSFTNAMGGVTTFYGQVNFVFQSFDDGVETTSGIVDNGNWNTRIGFRFTQTFDDITFRARFETGLGLRNSALVSQDFTPDWVNFDRMWLRWFEVAVDAPWGTVSAGQGSSASDGTAGLDESFTFHAGATDSSDGFGAFRFRDSEGNLTDVRIGQVNDSLDGARRFRLRYDTPSFGGVTLSTSYGVNVLIEEDENDYYDVAIRWSGDLGDVRINSAAGYQWIDRPGLPDIERVAGSFSAIHTPSGVNFNFSTGQVIDGQSYWWTRLGLRRDFFDAGTTSLSVDYYSGSDFLTDGSETEHFGIYAVQTIDRASLDLYAGWRRFSYSDRSGIDYQDADGILVGVRWAF